MLCEMCNANESHHYITEMNICDICAECAISASLDTYALEVERILNQMILEEPLCYA
jgi:hypothetical protein